jgi:hypothetical protein
MYRKDKNEYNGMSLLISQRMITMIPSDDIRITWFLLLLGMASLSGAFSQAMGSEIQLQSGPSEPSMIIEKQLPPIDTAAPLEFKTAFFGLG